MMSMKDTLIMNQSSLIASNIFEILNLRSEFEQIISFRKTYDLPSYNSDIDSLYYFINNGAKNNRFRKRFDEAMNIAKHIIKSYEDEKTNLSGLYGEEE